MLCLACSVFIPSRCENCMSRFRTYRSLFKHLHSCSDASTTSTSTSTTTSPALTSEKPIFPLTSSLEKEPPGKLLEELPKLQRAIQHIKKEALLPGTMDTPLAPDSLPAGLPGPLESVALLEQSLFGPPSLAKFSGPPHPSVSGPFLPYVHPTSYALPQVAVQNRLRPFLPAGQGLPVSNAVWKKSQGEQPSHAVFFFNTRTILLLSALNFSLRLRLVCQHLFLELCINIPLFYYVTSGGLCKRCHCKS